VYLYPHTPKSPHVFQRNKFMFTYMFMFVMLVWTEQSYISTCVKYMRGNYITVSTEHV